MGTFSEPFDDDENSPDCIQLPGPSFDLSGNVGISAPDVPVTDYYIVYSEESIFTRYSIAHPSNTPNFHVIYWSGTNWVVWNFAGGPDELAFPVASDRLLASISNGAVTQLADGVYQGIQTLSNFAGFIFTPNSFNGTFNTGEVDISAGPTTTLPDSSAVVTTAQKQLDGTYIREDNGETLTVDEAIAGGWMPCAEEEGKDTRLVSDACYAFEQSTPEVSTTTNTRNVGPALAGLVASFDVPVNNYRLLSFRATVDGTGSGNFTVTNTTTGETSDTSVESWAGAATALSARTFVLDTPVNGNVGDIITLSSNVTSGRWRYTFTTVGPIRLGTNGSAAPTNQSMAGFTVGEVFVSERYTVRTYENVATGALTYIQTDESGVRTELPGFDPNALPTGWTLPAHTDCEDHSAITARLDALENAPTYTVLVPLESYDTVQNLDATFATGTDWRAEPDLWLKVFVRDANGGPGWDPIWVNLNTALARFDANPNSVHKYGHVYDNDYVSLRIIDPSVGNAFWDQRGRNVEIYKIEVHGPRTVRGV